MSVRLFDTATAQVRPLQPRDGHLGIYVCGITPYDSAHLGHAFTYHVFDLISRRLRSDGVTVTSVRNITDCDDDVFRVARQRGIPHRRLVAEQVERFEAEMELIGIEPPDARPAASAHVPAMIDWIRRLELAGFAYAREGWVYFGVARFERYGDLSRMTRQQMLALSRTRGADPDDPRKRDPLDFVLWQPSLPDEMMWENPWGAPGRPGWHIECSVLATLHVERGIDLHGGGDDLVHPHHDSEIAQAEAIGPHPFARHWAHVAMVGLDGVKMSKSLGNLVFTADVAARIGRGAARLLLAAHHWRTPWSYAEAELGDAMARFEAAERAARSEAVLGAADAAALDREFLDRLDDDLDTPGALRVLDAVVRQSAPPPGDGSGTVRAAVMVPRLLGLLGAPLSAAARRSGEAPVA